MVKLYVTLLLFAGDVKDRLRRDDSGATAVEYGLLVGLIAVVIIGAVTFFGGRRRYLVRDVNGQICRKGGSADRLSTRVCMLAARPQTGTASRLDPTNSKAH